MSSPKCEDSSAARLGTQERLIRWRPVSWSSDSDAAPACSDSFKDSRRNTWQRHCSVSQQIPSTQTVPCSIGHPCLQRSTRWRRPLSDFVGRSSRFPRWFLRERWKGDACTNSLEQVRSSSERLDPSRSTRCLLYTSDAADDLTRVDLGGRRI